MSIAGWVPSRWIPSGAVNVVDKVVHGGVADLTRMPRTAIVGSPDAILYRYDPALTGSPEVRFRSAPGGHLGVLTGRRARTTTWTYLHQFLTDHA